MRAATAAVVSTALALGFHLAAGAPLPAAQGVVVPLIAAGAISLQFAGRAMSRARLALTVMLSQGAFHVTFGLGSATMPAVTSGGPHAVHSAATHSASHGIGAESIVTQAGHAGHAGSGTIMIVSHLAAAAATYVVLRRADVLLAWAARLVAAILSRLACHVAPHIGVAFRAQAKPSPLSSKASIAATPKGVRGPPLVLA